MTPNQLTVLRVAMAFAAVALFGLNTWRAGLVAFGLTAAAVSLDAVDGYLARRKNLATPLGAQLDILGDRIVENLFFTYFAVCGLVSLWVPVLFFVRGTLTDFIRGLAARAPRTEQQMATFRKNWMLESRWARALVASRVSRGAYGALKCACFCYLGLQLALTRGSAMGRLSFERIGMSPPLPEGIDPLLLGSQILVAATVAFCLLRGLPVIWEGRQYLAALARSNSAAV